MVRQEERASGLAALPEQASRLWRSRMIAEILDGVRKGIAQSVADEERQSRLGSTLDAIEQRGTAAIGEIRSGAATSATALGALARRSPWIVGPVLAAVAYGIASRARRGQTEPGAERAKTGDRESEQKGILVERGFTILRPRDELYAFWRDFTNLPRFMTHLESVTVEGNRSHWVAKAPLGAKVEWDAEIVEERAGELIRWQSLPDAQIPNRGVVWFVDGPVGRGTEVRVRLEYEPPAGRLGATIAKLLGEEPDIQVREDLRRFKRLMETGEVPTNDPQPRGTCRG